jgi:hypothetical protein
MKFHTLFVTAALAAASAAHAQYEQKLNTMAPAATPAPAASAPVAVQATPVQANARVLSANTPLLLNALEEVTSNGLEVGTKVRFSVAEDVVSQNMIVIPRGSPATGTVTWKTGKAVGGKSGKFEITFDEVVANGSRIRLQGKHRQEGKGNTVAAVFATWIISGRSAVMLPGQTVQAMTAEPVAF